MCDEGTHKYVFLYRRVRDGGTRKLEKSEIIQCKICHIICNSLRLSPSEMDVSEETEIETEEKTI